MTSFVLAYAALCAGAVIALSVIILRVGSLLGSCPASIAAARAASVSIAAGYAAIGIGMALLIGMFCAVLMADQPALMIAAAGLTLLCLGLGFSHAVATLRAVLLEPGRPLSKSSAA